MKYLLTTTAAVMMMASTALAADAPAPPPHHEGPPMMGGMMGKDFKPANNRQEAITNAKAYVTKLEKMSDADWDKMHKEHAAMREKRKDMLSDKRGKHEKRHKADKAAPAPAAAEEQ